MSNKSKHSGTLSVKELAQETGETPETIRYYAQIGLIHYSRDAENGYMCFAQSNIPRLSFIRKLQALGLTIGDIKSILVNVNQDLESNQAIEPLINQRLSSVRAHAAVLEKLEERISEAVAIWESIDCRTGAVED